MYTTRLIYASVAKETLTKADLADINAVAGANNRMRGITGLLCFGGGAFLQVLEGNRAAVNTLYRSVIRDPRHTWCELLECVPIESRSFSDWSMQCVVWEQLSGPTRDSLVLRYSGFPEFDPRAMTGTQAYEFLRAMGDLERHRAA
jgi:hypothetical protein